jgi:phosphoribosylformimino-5-aminoimidazole carboxamide ribotide isomerase
MSFTLYPSVDISQGRCVRPLQGRFGNEAVYSDDPADVAAGLSRAGATWLHIVDLDGAKSGEPQNRDRLLAAIKAASCPVQAGGGLSTLEDVEEVLAAGAGRAVLGSRSLQEEEELRRACARYGERIAVSLDAQRDAGPDGGWTVGSGVPVLDAVRRLEDAGVSRFIYTDVGRDGTMSGPDLAALNELTVATELPVVASGGIGSLEELRSVAALYRYGVTGAIVGRALYEGKFSVTDARLVAEQGSHPDYEEPLIEP